MNFRIRMGLVLGTFVLSVLCVGPAVAAQINKQEIKSTCGTAGGSYSEGSNYARCEYSNGDSYTCNTDVNKCETCTGGKCTVSAAHPGGVSAPAGGGAVLAPPTTPTGPKPVTSPMTSPSKKKTP